MKCGLCGDTLRIHNLREDTSTGALYIMMSYNRSLDQHSAASSTGRLFISIFPKGRTRDCVKIVKYCFTQLDILTLLTLQQDKHIRTYCASIRLHTF